MHKCGRARPDAVSNSLMLLTVSDQATVSLAISLVVKVLKLNKTQILPRCGSSATNCTTQNDGA